MTASASNRSPTRSAPLDEIQIRQVVADFGSSRTLPAAAYTSHEVFRWEGEHIFRSGWVCVGHMNDLLRPGQIRAVEVGGEGVLLVRDGNDTLHAFSNVCRHRGHELAPLGEAIDARMIRCPYHSWTYRADGTLRTAPTLTQSPGFDITDYPLIDFGVDVIGGWVYVDLSGDSGPLDGHFGNLAEIMAPYETARLSTAASHSYEVAANWKIVVENYNECYHCTSIHPELCQVTPPSSGVDHQPTGMWCGGLMDLKDHATTMSLDGASKGVRLRGVDDDLARRVWYVTVWPNLLLSMHPDYLMAHRLTPLDPGTTSVDCSWMFPPEAFQLDGFDPSFAVDFWDITNREDWAACEGVMRGMRNRGYRPGPLSAWEGTVYQFMGMIARSYLGEGLVVPQVPSRDSLVAES